MQELKNKTINNAHTENIMNRNNIDKIVFSYEIQVYEVLKDSINEVNEIIKK